MPKPISIIPASGQRAAFASVATQGKKREAGVTTIPLACLALVQFAPADGDDRDFGVVGYVLGEDIYCPEGTEDFLGYLGPDEDGFAIYGDASKAQLAENRAVSTAAAKEGDERTDKVDK